MSAESEERPSDFESLSVDEDGNLWLEEPTGHCMCVPGRFVPSLRDKLNACTFPEERESPMDRLQRQRNELLEALQALGVHPVHGHYCFCLNAEQQKAGHTAECSDARAAIAKAEAVD